MTPYELRALAAMRRRGQAPELAVFVMDDWTWATRLTNDVGVLAIRVCNAKDHEHDWTPMAGLWVWLVLRKPAPSDLADFSSAILRANPARLTVWDCGRDYSATVWDDAA